MHVRNSHMSLVYLSVSTSRSVSPQTARRRKKLKQNNTVKPVWNGISKDQKIFPLKPGFRLIKVYYNNLISQKNLKIFPFKTDFRLIKGQFKAGFTQISRVRVSI
jgi:hypothetical protein